MFDTEKFILVSNNLFLDFLNTMLKRNGEPLDLIDTYEDFLAWSIAVKLIDIEQAKQLLSKGQKKKTSEKIKSFRNILHNLAKDIITGKKINKSALSEINRKLEKQNTCFQIQFENDEFRKLAEKNYKNSDEILAEIAGSVADLLTQNKLTKLRICESDDCILFFYDTTKNRSRRWCSMDSCGNRAKANAFYQRKKVNAKEEG